MEDRVEIHVYSDGKVGGRTAVIEFDGWLYEAGATIIHENNMYLVDFAKTFGESSQFLIYLFGFSLFICIHSKRTYSGTSMIQHV